MGIIEQIEKEQKIEDFPENSILSYIAAFPKDTNPMVIALSVSSRFEGEKTHIHNFDKVTKKARDKLRGKPGK